MMKSPSMTTHRSASLRTSYPHPVLHLAVGCLLVLSFLVKTFRVILAYLNGIYNFNSFEMTEFLINYHGGFVRRGLFGEGLYHIYRLTGGFDICLAMLIFSLVIFLSVTVFFLVEFHRKKYCWWILFSPLLLNFPFYFIRKDFLEYALFIAAIWFLRKRNPSDQAKVGATLVMMIALLIHEPILFWGVPVYILLMWSYRSGRAFNISLIILTLLTALLTIVFKGSPEIVDGILRSWDIAMPEAEVTHHSFSAIGALAWDTVTTFKTHWEVFKGVNHTGQLLTPFLILTAYYMFGNFLNVFNFGRHHAEKLRDNKLAISLLYSSIMLWLFPFMILLCCDGGRVFQFGGVATFATFIIIPSNRIIALYPGWYSRLISRFNRLLDRFLPPGKGIMLILLLFVARSPIVLELHQCIEQSVIGSIWDALIYMRRALEFM